MERLAVRELPLFPLPNLVLFPEEVLPLHIFEHRYRMLLRTVLESDRRFGIVNINPETGQLCEVGCCAEVVQHKPIEGGRSNVVTVGQQRFRLLEIVREKPFRIGLVSWIDDAPPAEPLQELSCSVSGALTDVLTLTAKLTGKEVRMPDTLPSLPRELSFWVASHLHGATPHQQAMLEMTDTGQRLRHAYELLDGTRRQLAARTVLKDLESESAS
ncbi:MAG: ATP-dependent protease [Aphanocapsa feldmannii 277cV]|uniref:ATP-dependent protease n=2 Tax=Aphanocapsa feldmannii TaxID=192050 RepID=A0A524RLY8_9CHRO|nr:MAG: ATP-dependent protease [Aphanocapsa feldmannii 288cV]TGG91052.1 MAG: ATP-dependent protease [Aphanocapsa feldmannii 277cV]TGH27064.1 MAG: ATP-dependent protease [Aphanocapsa feldmannii 277cI]